VEHKHLSVRVVPDDGSVTLYCAGEIDMASVGTLTACLEQLDGGFRRVVVDLVEVSFLDSSGLGVLAQANQRFGPELRELIVRCPDGHVRRVLEISGLDQVIDVVA
jgi:anti-sigma B factor antagonist